MKSLSLIVLAVVSFGALALSGCTGCAQENNTNGSSTSAPQVTCGPGTRRVGNECIGTGTSTTNRPTTLNTSGNN